MLGLEKPKLEGKTADEVDFERTHADCTFKPNLDLTKGSKATKEMLQNKISKIIGRPKMMANVPKFIEDKHADSDSRKFPFFIA